MKPVIAMALASCITAPMWSGDAGGDASTGFIPDGVSLHMAPPYIKAIDENKILWKAFLNGGCFLDDIKFGVDGPCQLGPIPMICVRISCRWPFGVMEATDKYGGMMLDRPGWRKSLGSVKGKFLPFSKGASNIFASDKNSQSNIAAPIGRAGPPPLSTTVIAFAVTVLTAGQFCGGDFSIMSNWGEPWVLPEKDRGIANGHRGIGAPYLRSGSMKSISFVSCMASLMMVSVADIFGFVSYGQQQNKVGRSAGGVGAKQTQMYQVANNAWEIICAPTFIWGYLHSKPTYGPMRWAVHDDEYITVSGRLALAMDVTVKGTKILNLYPGTFTGCPSSECSSFFNLGNAYTPSRVASVVIEDQASRMVGNDGFANLMWPYITCCRMCMGDAALAAQRRFDTNFQNGIWWELSMPGGGNDNANDAQSQASKAKEQEFKSTMNTKVQSLENNPTSTSLMNKANEISGPSATNSRNCN